MVNSNDIERCKTCEQPIVRGAKAMILYFEHDSDMDEFLEAVQAVMPGLKGVPITDLKERIEV